MIKSPTNPIDPNNEGVTPMQWAILLPSLDKCPQEIDEYEYRKLVTKLIK